MEYRYSDRLIAFMDILGFGSLIATSANPKYEEETIARVTAVLRESIGLLEKATVSDVAFTQFSDSFAISVRADRPSEATLSAFTFSVLEIVRCFLKAKLFLRGGITRGKLLHNDDLLFGPAMNRAYELESKVARVPRIVLDPSTYSLVVRTILPYALRLDDDDLYYVDYIDPLKIWYVQPFAWQEVQRAIVSVPKTSELREKRAWLVRKYNTALKDFSFKSFKRQLDIKEDIDCDVTIAMEYSRILAAARSLHKLRA